IGLALPGVGPLSFNQVQELPASLPAVTAYRWMSSAFGGGTIMPVEIVLHDASGNFRSAQGLTTLASVRQTLLAASGVHRVSDPTAPTGQPIKSLTLSAQGSAAQKALTAVSRPLAAAGQTSSASALTDVSKNFVAPLLHQCGRRIVVPPAAIHQPALQKAMAPYISPGGHYALITVALKGSPYSLTNMNRLSTLHHLTALSLRHTPFHSAQIVLGGTTAVNHAVQQATHTDFNHTMWIIFAVIGVMLIIFLRSVPIPLIVLGGIGLNYLATLRITRWLSSGWLHQGIAWPVPFFSFLLLVGLGVDYVLFFMGRLREGSSAHPHALIQAGASSAAPIVSALAVMLGTFSSLLFTGVTTLEELGIAVGTGLILYLFLIIGIVLPSSLWISWPLRRWPWPLSHLWRRDIDNPPATLK
ncbi:MAG: MMPL family transporter, partial [Firmicutes bacterium]|nr:MMPL family transporter [Bacillota bacterium]